MKMKKTLATIARILRLYCIALWVGALVFFVVVAAVAFGNLPSTHEAGIVVRGTLLALHTLGTYAGFLYLLLTVMLLALGDRAKVRAVELILVVIMLGLTAYSQLGVIPAMERDRQQLASQYSGAEVDATPKDAPAHADFDRLHNVSTKVEGAVLLCGLVVLALSSMQGKIKEQ
ncbi:DUF4149 domain-containing protein [Granulicella sp. 5B5]|uniref:DUF4149 domain-containing protein n=1 Tax=Granulicella sp. 5B5 TaxID=1617967 RepID=UPI0015F5EFAF|nr:DUF4149 domain-containing protein [Granulicella sp. 5B5]QMV19817.1 DUF4149 domain-containing protein [Granulicella sp. 5B5]